MQRAVAIYRENLLTYSETFILNQGESLRRFTPYYVGTRRLPGLDLPCGRTLVLNGGGAVGRVEELVYKAADVSPRLVARLRALQPSLLHAHFGPDGAAALPLARQLHLPLIVTFHGYDATVRDAALRGAATRRDREFPAKRAKLLREGTLFIAVSDHIRRQLLLQGCPPEKLVTHHIGVDTAFFSPPAERTREPEVLFVGRLVEKKGCVHLLRAMREVQTAEPEARLTVVGDGPLRDELEAQARTLGVHCAFLGQQTPAEVRSLMARAKVFCLPSVTAHNGDTEGLPTVLVEAQAMGLPAVTSDSAGNPEVVLHERTGLVVPAQDERALARALLRLLQEELTWHRFSSAARQWTLDHFDIRKQTGLLEDLYEAVLNTHQTKEAASL